MLKDEAKKLFSSGLNCAQTVFCLFSEKYGISSKEALAISSGFGGGMRNGEVCGAVTGAIMVIGLKYGFVDGADTDNKQLCYKKTKEFTDIFRNRYNSIVCRDLLHCDISKKEGMKKAIELGLFKTTCVEMIDNAIDLLLELGY